MVVEETGRACDGQSLQQKAPRDFEHTLIPCTCTKVVHGISTEAVCQRKRHSELNKTCCDPEACSSGHSMILNGRCQQPAPTRIAEGSEAGG